MRRYLQHAGMFVATGLSMGSALAQTPFAEPVVSMHSPSWSWENLQDWSHQAHPSVQLSRIKEHVANLQLQLLEADSGTKLFASTGTDHAKESVTDSLTRSYSRTHGQVGVRMELLAAAEQRQRNVLQARSLVQIEAAQMQLQQLQSVSEIGRLYVRYQRSQQREQLAQLFTHDYLEAQTLTQRRVTQGFMLQAEALGLQELYVVAQTFAAREQDIQRTTLAQMAYLVGRPLAAQIVKPLHIKPSCQTASNDALDMHPLLEVTRIALESAQSRSALHRYGPIEGGIQLNQSVSKDWKGSAGHATGVALDVSIPWNWREQKNKLAAQLQAEQLLAQEQLHQEKEKLQLQSKLAWAQWQRQESALVAALHQYQTAQEVLRVATLRKETLDGDGLAQVIRSRHMLYERALQYINALEARDLAAVELGFYLEGCALQTSINPSDEQGTTFDPVRHLAVAHSLIAGNPTVQRNQQDKSAPTHSVMPEGTGWYAWKGSDWLKQPHKIDRLPNGTHRLLLSFDEQLLLQLSQPGQAAQQLQALAAQAQQRNIRLDLLLGEPTWVLPEARAHLHRLITSVQGLPFHTIHLDLERSQLKPNQQLDWEKHTIALLTEVTQMSAVPIALTTHHREFVLPGFMDALSQAGVKEIVPMIYSSNPATTLAVVRKMPALPEGMQLALAQSIEVELNKQESYYFQGKAKAALQWKQLAQTLAAEMPGFNGIIVQSWDEYVRARP